MNRLTEIQEPRTEWRLYVPLLGQRLRDPANQVATYPDRREALEAAEKFAGSVLIEEVVVETAHITMWPGL